MVTQQLLEYINAFRSKGFSDDVITQNLVKSGWTHDDIHQAMINNLPVAPLPPAAGQTSVVTSPVHGQSSMWDAFEHILQFISLYVLATSFALLLHTFIDRWFPAVTDYVINSYSSYSSTWQDQMIRGYLAAIIVSFPLFSFFFLRITKRTEQNPVLRTIAARKFLIYLTLVITFIIMVFYIIQIVYTLLDGNISFNFVLHFMDTVGICGIIFLYYLHQVKEDRLHGQT